MPINDHMMRDLILLRIIKMRLKERMCKNLTVKSEINVV